MKLLPLLKSKRGVALESAILFMTVIFSFCFILTSIALIGRNRSRLDSIYLENYVFSEQIGEHFVGYLDTLDTNAPSSDGFVARLSALGIDLAEVGYSVSVANDGDMCSLTVRDGGEDGIAVLCVQANFGGDSVSLISWNRTADENTES